MGMINTTDFQEYAQPVETNEAEVKQNEENTVNNNEETKEEK